MKLNERGRGKFKPAPDYSIEDVRNLLFQKIEEERKNFESCGHSIDFNGLSYIEGKFNLLSLFSGCGGLDLGFELAGLQAVIGEEKALSVFKGKSEFDKIRKQSIFHTIYANDLFAEATQSYTWNFPSEVCIDSSDIRKIKSFPKADIVLGGFPCPGFSEAGPRLVDDERNFLYLHFIRCLMQSKPYIFVAENVKGMTTLGKGEVFNQIVQDFAAAGYTIYHKLLDAKDYGVPQTRERVLLIGVRNDIDYKYEFLPSTHGPDKVNKYITLKDAIFDLNEDPGSYFTGSYSTIFMSRNRKKSWEEPSFTIQASGRQAPIHPGGAPMQKVGKDEWIFTDGEENNRRLSVKEIARIQTFPDWFKFSDGKNDGKIDNARLDKIHKQIGNAVPVMLAYAVAKPIADWAVQFIKSNQYKHHLCEKNNEEASA
ncbi:MAG: DNA (cytosine-5-)-methyltransferase [Clostridiales bacterium GWB2_37_7]|nr:MAG: DNA (cytosine-5-)-methyltransferase [Clostridiales bacterium GWB2_37_7]